jgi:hypothetical protein
MRVAAATIATAQSKNALLTMFSTTGARVRVRSHAHPANSKIKRRVRAALYSIA